jgi:hypothetical protein
MSSFLGRNSRRRRVLNEEALSASSAHLAIRATTVDEPAERGPRYSEAAGFEHHPQISDFLPRRYRTIACLAVAGLISTAAVVALDRFVTPAVTEYGFDVAAAFALTGSTGVVAWFAAVLLLVSAGNCSLIYSLRRHRIDDYRGRYRVWLAAAAVCVALSVDAVAPIHRLVAAAAAYHTGWTALRGHAAWWLALGGLPLGWIALRSWLDARESPLAAVLLMGSFVSYGVGIASFLGIGSVLAPHNQLMLTAGAVLAGHWMLLIGLVSYGRFVVLDAQGLVPVRQRKRAVTKQTNDNEVSMSNSVASRTTAASDSPLRSFRQSLTTSARPAPVVSEPTEWVNGSEPEGGNYDDDDHESGGSGRKLTKAERKRLRKLKARDRAA